MAEYASCSTIPTLTQTSVTTTQSTSTTVSSSITTSPPTTTFITSIGTICTPRIGCQITTQVTNSTIQGTTQTVEVTQTTVFPVTNTVVNTLFSTSCTATSSGGSRVAVTPTSPTSSTPSTSFTSSTILPSLSTMTSMSSWTAADGSVFATPITETQTIFPTSSSVAGAQNSNANTTTSTSNLGAIIGGSVGGFFGLAAVALLAWYLWKRNHNWDDVFEREHDTILRDVFPKPKRDPPLDPEPKPYQYGIVGRAAVPPHMSPPSSSAGLSLSSDGANAYFPAHNAAPQQQPYHHSAGQQTGTQQQQQQVAQQQQSVGQQQAQQQVGGQQQQSVVQQQWNGQQQVQQQVGQQQQSVVQQQWNGPQQQSVMPQQQQSVGPQAGQGASQQTHGRLPSFSTNSHGSHAMTAASVASLRTRPSAAVSLISSLQEGASTVSAPPGAWEGGLYPPGMQRNPGATVGVAQSTPGTGQRESVLDENEVYGGIATDVPITGHSAAAGAVPHHSAGVSNAGPGSNSAEFDPYQERQRPVRERRDGKGRLITTGEKPPIIHLDGGRYREQALSPGPSLGRNSVTAPPAYSV